MRAHALHLARRLASRLSASPFRLVAFVLHATGLERFYKPRFTRYSALMELTDQVVARLPKYCYTVSGAQNDPMNLIFVAGEADLKATFKEAGWYRANPASPIHVAYGLIMALMKRSYNTGPFAPLYVNIALQDLAYQQSTITKSFRQRHHLRVWRTGIVLPGGKRVWVGSASLESGMRWTFAVPFWSHQLDPNIDAERSHVALTLQNQGASRIKTVSMTEAVMASKPRRNAFGSHYFTDGQAVVVEL
jgi:hypothetical protein